mgnify:CR=1 FL=1
MLVRLTVHSESAIGARDVQLYMWRGAHEKLDSSQGPFWSLLSGTGRKTRRGGTIHVNIYSPTEHCTVSGIRIPEHASSHVPCILSQKPGQVGEGADGAEGDEGGEGGEPLGWGRARERPPPGAGCMAQWARAH